MEYLLNVYEWPDLVTPDELAGGAVVVIDVLRSSTTIVHALEAGAIEVIPCMEVEDARRTASELGRGSSVLGGERHGLPIQGFDLGNSPTEYTPEAVANRTVVLTTTNGTRAMAKCHRADRVYIGAFVNASAVVKKLLAREQIHLLCAGTEGRYSHDDVLLAGLLVEWLHQRSGMPYRLNAQALTAREAWCASFALPQAIGAEPLNAEVLARELRKSFAGQHLAALGMEDDILTASYLDRFSVVPELDVKRYRIRVPG